MSRICTLIAVLLTSLFISCDKKPADKANPNERPYGILVYSADAEKEFLIRAESLMEGSYEVPKTARQVEPIVFAYKDGSYYGIDENKRSLTRYKPTENELVADKVCSLDTIPWKYFSSWYDWVSPDTLLIGSTMEGSQFVYALVDVRTMTVASHGTFDIPFPVKPEYYGGVFAKLRDNRIYIAYTLYEGVNSLAPARDTTYMAVVEYPSMKTLDLQKDTRSTWPGGYFLHAPFSLVNNGDIYLLTQPGGRTHNHPTKSTGIYRIKKGEDKLDPTYFFRPTDQQNQEGYLLYDLGNGKALIKMVEKKRVNRYMDYLEKRIVDYYILDLYTQKKTRIDLPPDRLKFEYNVLVENDQVYVAVNNGNNESTIWRYHVPSGKLTEGITIDGQVYMINRLQ
ncbi:hypothetical protein [Dyadobacter sp. CY323]|uniref:hypothetical protein n=1 Tax=Dyadobacter sp. CY323 TaxID=2907302 RepID=UPI001F1C32E1|nr:hypothetical protein [Dyadobacter sp. CY323]MCE6988073.1 hypothetical protein [Dyadobacter sp. CY323]